MVFHVHRSNVIIVVTYYIYMKLVFAKLKENLSVKRSKNRIWNIRTIYSVRCRLCAILSIANAEYLLNIACMQSMKSKCYWNLLYSIDVRFCYAVLISYTKSRRQYFLKRSKESSVRWLQSRISQRMRWILEGNLLIYCWTLTIFGTKRIFVEQQDHPVSR